MVTATRCYKRLAPLEPEQSTTATQGASPNRLHPLCLRSRHLDVAPRPAADRRL